MTTIEDQIAELLAQAEPLRALPDLEAEAKGLPGIVDRINALRADQADYAKAAEVMAHVQSGDEPLIALAEVEQALEAPARKKPGRKPKVAE